MISNGKGARGEMAKTRVFQFFRLPTLVFRLLISTLFAHNLSDLGNLNNLSHLIHKTMPLKFHL